MYRMVSHAGHFLYNSPCLDGVLLPGSPTAYLLSKPLNWLDLDPSYPKDPKTLGNYIRKWRMDKGISQVELARTLGVNEMTIVNWEIKAKVPRIKAVRERLTRAIPGAKGLL
jgi:DNA-binding XRE family transcriptional regulator